MSVRNTMRPTIFSLYGRCPRPLCEKVIMSGGLFCQFNKKIFLFDNFKQKYQLEIRKYNHSGVLYIL